MAALGLEVVQQLKRGQGETNERLDRIAAALRSSQPDHGPALKAQAAAIERLAAEQARTNQLLEWLGSLLAQRAPTT